MNPLEEKIIKIISQSLDLEEKEINLTTDFFNDLNLEPLVIADVMLTVGEAFEIKISAPEIEQIKTVSDIVKIVEEKSDEFL